MKLRISLLGSLLFASVLFGQVAPDIHSPEGFMPLFEGWKVVKVEPLAKEKKRFRRNKPVKGAEIKMLKSSDGRKGALVFASGLVVVKIVEVERDHTHAAVITDEDRWVFGEGGTLSMQNLDNGLRFCLEDFVAKKPACGALITLQRTF